mmetsp:Transcript_23712/g.51218  ORF Transcript_23712/g.51218 Transcript_23712/m.51218 type:complete len:89 (-) Transcript_23712:286-552(-)
MAPPASSSSSSSPNSFKNPFSSGLSRGGRIGAWVAAIGIVAAWNYYDNRKNTADSFSTDEQGTWNAQVKRTSAENAQVTMTTAAADKK